MKSELDKVLEYVNKAREARGLKSLKRLLKGVCGDGYACPLTRSLGNVFSGENTIRFNDIETTNLVSEKWGIPVTDDWYVPTPSLLKKFITKFDNDEYPELILKGNRVR